MAIKATRETVLSLLIEAGKGPDETSFQLTMAGHAGLTKAEIAKHFPAVPTAAQIAAAAKAASATQEPKDKAQKKQSEAPTEKPNNQAAKLLSVAGKKADGTEVTHIHGMMTAMFYQMVDCMRILHPEAYAEYRAIKYPSGVEDLATDETKKKAYLFAFQFMFDKHKV